jgi:hypothetical protein
MRACANRAGAYVRSDSLPGLGKSFRSDWVICWELISFWNIQQHSATFCKITDVGVARSSFLWLLTSPQNVQACNPSCWFDHFFGNGECLRNLRRNTLRSGSLDGNRPRTGLERASNGPRISIDFNGSDWPPKKLCAQRLARSRK